MKIITFNCDKELVIKAKDKCKRFGNISLGAVLRILLQKWIDGKIGIDG